MYNIQFPQVRKKKGFRPSSHLFDVLFYINPVERLLFATHGAKEVIPVVHLVRVYHSLPDRVEVFHKVLPIVRAPVPESHLVSLLHESNLLHVVRHFGASRQCYYSMAMLRTY